LKPLYCSWQRDAEIGAYVDSVISLSNDAPKTACGITLCYWERSFCASYTRSCLYYNFVVLFTSWWCSFLGVSCVSWVAVFPGEYVYITYTRQTLLTVNEAVKEIKVNEGIQMFAFNF